jgi:hypothetical protein
MAAIRIAARVRMIFHFRFTAQYLPVTGSLGLDANRLPGVHQLFYTRMSF